MRNYNLFDMFENNEEIIIEETKEVVETKELVESKEETKEVVETEEEITETVETEEETNSNEVSSDSKSNKTTKGKESKKSASKPKVDNDAKILADLKKAKKIICKVFGQLAFSLEDEEQIKAINTKQDIIDLLFDNGFEEFAAFNPELKCSVREDGTAILLPLYPDMKAKG